MRKGFEVPILTNLEITDLASRQRLINDTDPASFQPCSYDMRIGAIYRDGQVIDGNHQRSSEQVRLNPGEVITMTTLETLDLPADIAATAYAINAQSSEGLLVLNPGHVDPGYKGFLTVMAINMRRVPYVVSRKDRIFTVVFQRLGQKADPPYLNRAGSREDKERDLNKKVVEKAVTSLGDLIALNAPFTRPDDVNKLIRTHWATSVTLVAAILSVLASVVAAVFAVATFFHSPPAAMSEGMRNAISPASMSIPAVGTAPVTTPQIILPVAPRTANQAASNAAITKSAAPTVPPTVRAPNDK